MFLYIPVFFGRKPILVRKRIGSLAYHDGSWKLVARNGTVRRNRGSTLAREREGAVYTSLATCDAAPSDGKMARLVWPVSFPVSFVDTARGGLLVGLASFAIQQRRGRVRLCTVCQLHRSE
jgi:hypothetical protein